MNETPKPREVTLKEVSNIIIELMRELNHAYLRSRMLPPEHPARAALERASQMLMRIS